jgi:tetratricopeptide (TPR) repeat protein
MISKAVEYQPKNPTYLFNLGNAYQANKEFKKSIEFYDKALEIKIDFGEAVKARKLAREHLL